MGQDFRTTPAFAELLDRLIKATHARDDAAMERVLLERPEWRQALEEERAFLLHVESSRPGNPSTSTHASVPVSVHSLPMPLAQTWLAVLDATTAADRIDSAHFTFETYTVYLLAAAVGAYGAVEEEDKAVADSIRRLGRNGESRSVKSRNWLETLDTIFQWSSSRGGGVHPEKEECLSVLSAIEGCLQREVEAPAILELVEWLDRLNRTGTGRGTRTTTRDLLETVLTHRMTAEIRPGAVVQGADAERTAEMLEAGMAALLSTPSLVHDLLCAYVRTVEPISKDLFLHGIVDLMGTSPLTRRGGLLLNSRQLEPGHMYILPKSGHSPIPLNPFFVFQDGKTLRLSFARDWKGFSYSACMAGEGRIDRAVRPGGFSWIEALLLPRDAGDESVPPPFLASGMKEVIGDFRILRQIGEGGMALVYLAEQRPLGREVALKVLHKSRLTTGFIERFRREGKAIGRLEHPNIVKIYSIGEEDGVPYLAMEYIHGNSLEKLLRDANRNEVSLPRAAGDRSPMEVICRITRETALALNNAHDHGIIHRDVKPGNILIDEDGHAHLTDFGLAQERGKASITMTGDMVGTPHYLSPEQVAAKRIEVDHRTDVYSLGVSLYQMLTGRPPFVGETLEQILRQIALKEPTPPRKLNPRVPRDLETICLHAMEKDPDARYASILQMADDLKAVTDLRPIQASRVGPVRRILKLTRRRPAVSVLSLLLLAVLIIGGVTSLHRLSQDAATIRESLRFGRAMEEVGRPDSALPFFQRVLDLDPDNEEARKNVNRILFMQDMAKAYELAFDWPNPEDDAPAFRCLELLDRIQEGDQGGRRVNFLRAQVLVRLGKRDSARMKEALELVNSLEETRTSVGLQLLRIAALEALNRPEAARLRKEVEARPPRDDQDRLVLAGAYMAEEKWRQAMDLYNDVLRKGDRNLRLTAASQAARCSYWLKDYDSALSHLALLENEHGHQQPNLLRRRALYLFGSGEEDSALQALDEALERKPNYVLALLHRGYFLYQKHRCEDALKSLNDAIALAPSFSLLYGARSQVYGLMDDLASSLRDLDTVLKLRPGFPKALLARARVYTRLGEQHKTRLHHRKSLDCWENAITDLKKLLKHQPDSARALAELALVYHKFREERYDRCARENAEKALELDPGLGQAHYALGLIHYHNGDRDQALEYLDDAIECEPSLPGALEIRAHLHSLSGRFDQALDDLDAALKQAPHYIQAKINRALVFIELGRLAEAEADIRAVLEKAERAEAYLALFQIHMKQGPDWEAAIDALESALETNPELSKTHLNLGLFFRERARAFEEDQGRNFASSVAFYAEGMRLGGESGHVAANLKSVKKQAARCFLAGEAPAGPLDHALRGFGRWKKEDPEGAAADLNRGVEGLEAGADKTANTRIEHYIHKQALLLLAQLAENLGRFDQSRKLYRRILDTVDPTHPLALEKVGR